MTPAASRRLAYASIAVSLVLAGILLAASLGVLWRPLPSTPEGDFFIAADSSQIGGVFRLHVSAAEPIDVTQDDSVELEIVIETDAPDAKPRVTLGGVGATSLEACTGEGAKVEVRNDMVGFDDLHGETQTLLVSYYERQRASGYLFVGPNGDSLSNSEARSLATRQLYRTAEVSPTRPSIFSFETNDDAVIDYPATRAELTCIVSIDAFVGRSGYVTVFRAPDLLIGMADVNLEGPMHASFDLRLANDVGLNPISNTFSSTRAFVEPTTERQFLEVKGEWWTRGGDGEKAVANATGYVQLEPDSAPTGRVYAQLAAGFLASLILVLCVALGRLLLTRPKED